MKITYEPTLQEFNAWCGAEATKQAIIEADKEAEFIQLVEDNNPWGMTETELNDFLWYDSDYIYEYLGMIEESDEE